MRTIKFRGVDMETGETVYGELGTIFTTCTGDKYYFGSEHSVKPESVKQLIGVDSNGAEVYEGDTVTKDGRTWKCFLKTDCQEVSQ